MLNNNNTTNYITNNTTIINNYYITSYGNNFMRILHLGINIWIIV